MKQFVIVLFIIGFGFLVGCASPINSYPVSVNSAKVEISATKKGVIYRTENGVRVNQKYNRAPAVVVIDNSRDENILISIDGRSEFTWQVNKNSVKSLLLQNISDKIIFVAKFPQTCRESIIWVFNIYPGVKKLISVPSKAQDKERKKYRKKRRTIGNRIMDVHNSHLDNYLRQVRERNASKYEYEYEN